MIEILRVALIETASEVFPETLTLGLGLLVFVFTVELPDTLIVTWLDSMVKVEVLFPDVLQLLSMTELSFSSLPKCDKEVYGLPIVPIAPTVKNKKEKKVKKRFFIDKNIFI